MDINSSPSRGVNDTPRENAPERTVDHLVVVWEKDRASPLTIQKMYVNPEKGEELWKSFNSGPSNESTLYSRISTFLYMNGVPRTIDSRFDFGWKKKKPTYSFDDLHTHFKRMKGNSNNHILYLVKANEFLVVGVEDFKRYSPFNLINPVIRSK